MGEVYLQLLVYFNNDAIGMARPDQALFERLTRDEQQHLDAATELARSLGISFNASGATEPGESLARKFKGKSPGVWELTLSKPLTDLPKGKLTVSVKDRQGNVTRIERTFSVGPNP